MRKLFSAAAMAVAVLSAPVAANAGTVLFDIGEAASSLTINNSCTGFFCGLYGDIYEPVTNINLQEGESDSITFGWLQAYGIGLEDNAFVTLNLAFSNPVGAALGNGANVAYATFLGIASKGKIDWSSNSQLVTAANGTQFTVSFADEMGLQFGRKDLSATITLNSVVPEPATWALMIGGFGMAGGALRRRRAVGATA